MPETEPPVAKNELADQKTLVIRGHHLPLFAGLANRYAMGFPDLKASEISAGYTMRDIVETSLDATRRDFSRDTAAKQEVEYAQDVLGIDLAQANKFERHLVQTFEKFLRLPDSHAVEIVEGVPDIICTGCAIGEHCRRRIERIGDTMYMDAFLITISLLNLPEPAITHEQARFPNAEPEQVRRIKTTLGTVKKILEERKSIFW